jgi:molybdopterin converting factor subunit 1
MTLAVRLFARARDLAGCDVITLEVSNTATVGQLRERLAVSYPALANILARCALAVNDEFAEDEVPVPSGAEIALLPPVSGG